MKKVNVVAALITVFSILVINPGCQHDCEEVVPDDGDPPVEPCDTTNITYDGSVFPIFQQYCLSCHSGETPEGGIDLNNYDQVAFLAESGTLLGALRHEEGYTPMPQNSPMLDSCLIARIEIWVRDTTFTDPPVPNPCDPDTVYFEADLLPILLSTCARPGCHDVTAQDGVRLDSYEAVMASNVVVPGDPLESEMYENIIETDPDKRMPPPPNDPMPTENIQLVYKWISQGAQNLFCEADCDTTNVTFSGVIWPEIIQKSCTGCHSGASPNGGVSLENYEDVVAVAQSGQLLGVIEHQAGYPPMPQNGPQLSDCKITQIRKWIDDGTPNN